MDKTTVRVRVSGLISEINEHNYRYYILNSPVIDDVRYDMLVKELEALETQYPDLVQPDSPTQRVGSDLTKEFVSVIHKHPMLSLSNTYSKEELFDFHNRVQKAISGNVEFVSELKFDGVAIGLTYTNGRLVMAVTRGDGIQGDDVTANAKTIRSIPLQLRGNNYPAEFEIRGEVFLTRNQFEILNKLREEEGDQPFANPRNAAAGSLKMQDPAAVDNGDSIAIFTTSLATICHIILIMRTFRQQKNGDYISLNIWYVVKPLKMSGVTLLNGKLNAPCCLLILMVW